MCESIMLFPCLLQGRKKIFFLWLQMLLLLRTAIILAPLKVLNTQTISLAKVICSTLSPRKNQLYGCIRKKRSKVFLGF